MILLTATLDPAVSLDAYALRKDEVLCKLRNI